MLYFPLLGEQSPGKGSSVGTLPSTSKRPLGKMEPQSWPFQNADIPTPAPIAAVPTTIRKSRGT